METYTRATVQGVVSGQYAALVDAAAAAVDAMLPADVVNLVSSRRERSARLADLVAAVSMDYAALSA
ncbi:MAG: hypothetical protein QOD07_2122 [Frankiaceae bacterium]|jgi:hypothetical protein|nr:hypothetical protein [Frankiaceae bacterium]